MKIQEAPLPAELKEALSVYLKEVKEYLELEEPGFSADTVKYASFLTADDSVGFVIFDYVADDRLSFAFVQLPLASGSVTRPRIGCWPREEGKTLEWSIGQYLEMNPISRR